MSFPRIAAAALAFAAMCSSAAAADDEPLLVARLPEGREVPLVLLSTDGEGTVRLLTWKRGAQERRQWLAMPASALESVELSLPDGSPFEGGAVKLVRSDVSVRMGPDDLFLNDQGGTRPLALYVSDESFEEHVVLSIPEAGVTFPSPPAGGGDEAASEAEEAGGDSTERAGQEGEDAEEQSGDGDEPSPLAVLMDLDALANGASLNDVEAPLAPELRKLFGDVETLNPLLEEVLAGARERWSLLDAVELDLGAISADGETSLGLRYEVEEELDIWDEDVGGRVTGTNFRLSSKGTVAFEDGVNPMDFLDTRLTFNYFRSRGGVGGERSDAAARRFNELATALAGYESDADFLASDEWRDIQAIVRDRFTTQVYWELGLDAAVESDQRFDDANYAFGAHAALDVKGWGSDSAVGRWNLPDYAFAVVRRLTGYDRDAVPMGSTFPTFLVGLDSVDPSDNDARSNVDADTYVRARAEVAMKTPVARTEEAEYFAVLSWRYYHELDAPSAVRDADIDRFSFFSASIESSKGLFVSYNEGKLPLDVTGGSSVQVGWKFDF